MHEQLSFKQACEHLRIPEQTLRDFVKYDEVPHRKQGDEVYFDSDTLDAWASRRILGLRRKELCPEHTASTLKEVKFAKDDLILPTLLDPSYISLDFRAKTRKSIMREVVAKAEELGLLCDPMDLLRQIEEREAVSSTALPGGIALLHPHHPDPYLIVQPFMLIFRNLRPIWFGAEDDTPTDIFCLICCGENQRHLHVLARLCMMIRETDFLLNVRAANSAEEIAEVAYESERQILAQMH